MNIDKLKTIRVEIEKDDGTIIRITKEEAEKWDKACESMVDFCFAHNILFPELEWEEYKKVKRGTLDVVPDADVWDRTDDIKIY